jgi:hypothetical protein
MQPLEAALFTAVIALAAALVVGIVWPHLRSRRSAVPAPVAPPATPPAAGAMATATAGAALVCPACHREYEAGLQFCPYDARDLVRIADPAARGTAPGTACPTCKRSYEGSKKFCAFDGDELVPLSTIDGAAGAAGNLPPLAFAGSLGKICPSCSRRYQSDATFCGRDGAELVSVN